MATQVHAGRLVLQIHFLLRIDFPGNLAHGVHGPADLIHRLRMIPQPEGTAACDLA
jgi:hypothetical protein